MFNFRGTNSAGRLPGSMAGVYNKYNGQAGMAG